jgi:hypothetical protein
MRNRLLILGCFAHNSHGVLATVYRLALMGIKLRLNFLFRVILRCLIGPELGIATFADADSWEGRLYDAQFSLLHDCSLAHRVAMA